MVDGIMKGWHLPAIEVSGEGVLVYVLQCVLMDDIMRR